MSNNDTQLTPTNILNRSYDATFDVMTVENLEYAPTGAMVRKVNDPMDGYRIADIDDASPSYYGFTRTDGSWYILRNSSNAFRYVKGAANYSTAWTNRASQTFDYLSVVFG